MAARSDYQPCRRCGWPCWKGAKWGLCGHCTNHRAAPGLTAEEGARELARLFLFTPKDERWHEQWARAHRATEMG